MLDPSLKDCLEGVDLGVEEEITMDMTTLATDLGFDNGLPFLFNRSRHSMDLNTWDSPLSFDIKDASFDQDYVTPLSLHWHQVAGIHSILRHVFSPEPDVDHCCGMLVADEVGLGKTAMAIGIISSVSHFIWLQEHKSPLPPILRKCIVLNIC